MEERKTPGQVSATDAKEFYLSSAEEVCREYDSDSDSGLGEEEARSRLDKYGRNAFEKQMRGEGYTCVEVISPCPTNWHMTPQQASERIKKEVLEVYPLGEFVKGE